MRSNLWLNICYILANLALLVILVEPRAAAARPQPEPPRPNPGTNKNLVPGELRYIVTLDPLGQPLSGPDNRLTPTKNQIAQPPEPPPPPPPPPARTHQGRIWYRMPTNEKVIALTFDDGPAGNWRQLLDILDSRNVKATFFLLGNLSLNNPEAVRETAARGHELASHTWSHPKLPDLSIERIRWQISSGAAAIEATGVKVEPFFRPPYGSRDDRVDRAARELGFHTILWDVDTRDWELKDPNAVLQRALAGLKPGAIILFHDGPATTPQMLGAFIDQAHAQGYEFVLLSRYIR